ncbi:MAG: hypothetical protein KJT03_15160 [Verrucomicrobiae bacterium]|nr:hypothetical protein [Verrucomicrobiae bacterium]
MKHTMRRSLLFVPVLAAFCANTLVASNCPLTLSPLLREVSFQGSAPGPVTGHHILIFDDTATTFSAPHYTNPDIPQVGKRYPTAFTKANTPQVQMKFELEVDIPEGETCTATVKASGTDGVNLPVQTFTLLDGKNTYTYGWNTADGAFPDKIRFYGPGEGTFEFDWKIKVNTDGADFQSFHKSKHRIYLTSGTPIPSQGNRETLFYYACHKPDGNAGVDGKIVTHLIWDDFATKAMKRINHTTGILYGPDLQFTVQGGDILVNGRGVCATWSALFRDVLSVHAYSSEMVEVDSHGITLPDGSTPSNTAWLVSQQTVVDSTTVVPGPLGVNRGQGNAHGSTAWSAHAIAKAFGELFDASYGIGQCTDQASYEASAISGFSFDSDPDIFGNSHVEYMAKDVFSRLNYTYVP